CLNQTDQRQQNSCHQNETSSLHLLFSSLRYRIPCACTAILKQNEIGDKVRFKMSPVSFPPYSASESQSMS
ncbi:MAG: hypothetical protein ABIK07_17615, partial [Planctomycetota bacterium]